MAKITIAELVAKFTGDTTGLEKAVTKATSVISKYTALAGGAAVAGTIALTRAQMKAIDANVDLANQVGISTKSLAAMKLVFDESGTSANNISGALGIMQRNLFAAATGSDAQKVAIQALGLEIDNLINMAPDQQFGALAEAISEIENPTVKAGVASQIFGRNAKELMIVFDDYSAKTEEITAFQEKFNLSVSNIDSEKVGAANDALARVFSVVQGIGNAVAVEVAPAISVMSQAVLDSLPSFNSVDDVVRKIIDSIAVMGEFARRSFHGMQVSLQAIEVAGLKTIKVLNPQKWFGQEGKEFDAILGGAERKLKDTIDAFDPEDTLVDKLYKARANAETKALEQVRIAATSRKAGTSADVLGEIFNAKEAEKAKDSVDKVTDAYKDLIKEQEKFRSDVASTFSDFTKSIMRGESVLDSFRSKVMDVFGSIIDSMFQMSFGGKSGGGLGGTIAEALFGAFGIGSNPVMDTFGSAMSNYNSISGAIKFADGGVVSGPTVFPIGNKQGMMGEAGPEAIMPLTRGPGGRLGVAAHGSGATVNQTLNFSLGVQQTVRAEIASLLPQIQAASVDAVQNSINRGSMKT